MRETDSVKPKCFQCEKESDKLYPRGFKEFCSLECMNEYLESEGFLPVDSVDTPHAEINPEYLL